MGRNKAYREIIREANDRLLDWEDVGNVPDSIQQYRDMLSNFYRDAGKNVKNPKIISSHAKLTDEQEEELIDIAESINANEKTDIELYEDFLTDQNRSNQREALGVTDIESAVEILDILNNYSSNASLSSMLSSDQVVELFQEGHDKGLSDDEIEQYIEDAYNDTGAEGNDLYTMVWDAIDEVNNE